MSSGQGESVEISRPELFVVLQDRAFSRRRREADHLGSDRGVERAGCGIRDTAPVVPWQVLRKALVRREGVLGRTTIEEPAPIAGDEGGGVIVSIPGVMVAGMGV